VTTAHIFGKLSNVVIRNNRHQGATDVNVPKVGCVLYYGDLQNITVENNIFENCYTPQSLSSLSNERPFFRNNKYTNVVEGTFTFWQSSSPYIVEPQCERVVVSNNTNNSAITVEMNITGYVDGQGVLIIGSSASEKTVLISKNSSTVECQTDIALNGQGQQVSLRFNKSSMKWYAVY
ncbi:hypothetical protein WDZ92_39315, partial [Nostoc sp. NIES-2111]